MPTKQPKQQPPPMSPRTAIRKLTDGGMNQSTIAAACGVTRQAISLIANGKRPNVSYLLACRLVDMARAAEAVR